MFRLALCLTLGFATGAGAQALPAPATVQRLADSLSKAFVAGGGSPSVVVSVVRGKDTLLLGGYGMANLETQQPASAKSVYRIGSVTKQFTAAAVMQLVEQGKVKLDDPIGKYLPSLPDTWEPATVRQLLNHTSGIPSYTSLGPAWRSRWGEDMSTDTIVALSAGKPLDFPIGTKYAYNNSGYVILGMLIEKVTGRSWGEDLQERFAKPLGLTDTRNCLTETLIPNRGQGYEKAKDSSWVNSPFLSMSQPHAAGAMCSTAGDLVRWNQALHNGKVVSAESYRQMTTPVGPAVRGRGGYGFGLGVDSVAGRLSISHGGGIPGFITANTWIPSAQLSVTVIANSGSARSGELARQLVNAALGLPIEQRALVP
ncbi:MAG: serine hydrolase domain-containing protein [Gemmatimonadales bacterium]